MSVRFGGSGTDRYFSSTNLPGGTFTFTCWAQIVTDRNANSAIFKITGTNSVWMETDADGTTMKVWDTNGAVVRLAGPNMTVGTWYKLALVSSGANTASLYYAQVGDVLTKVDAGTWTVPSVITEVSFGASNAANEPFNGRMAAVKLWTSALTTTQIDAELNQFAPAVTSGLQRYHPFRVTETTDYSGNGFTLSGGTGSTTEADPPISDTASGGTVAHVATSTPTPVGTTTTASTTAVTPTLPTGTTGSVGGNQDRVFVVQAGNNTNGGTPANWTAAATDVQVGPTGTAPGAGTGRRYLSVFYRDYDGAWTMPAFSLTSAAQNTNALSAIALRKGATDTWGTPVVSTAGNTSSAVTSYSVTTGSLATSANGMVIVGTATNDNVTASAETLSGTAATLTSLTERSDTGSATGNDVSIKTYTAAVTVGGTGTFTHAATLSGASEGGSVIVAQSATAAASSPPSPPILRLLPLLVR